MSDHRANHSRRMSTSSGQAVLEYVLLMIFVVGISTMVTRGILKSFNLSIFKLNSAIERDLKTGRSPVVIYKNDT